MLIINFNENLKIHILLFGKIGSPTIIMIIDYDYDLVH